MQQLSKIEQVSIKQMNSIGKLQNRLTNTQLRGNHKAGGNNYDSTSDYLQNEEHGYQHRISHT